MFPDARRSKHSRIKKSGAENRFSAPEVNGWNCVLIRGLEDYFFLLEDFLAAGLAADLVADFFAAIFFGAAFAVDFFAVDFLAVAIRIHLFLTAAAEGSE